MDSGITAHQALPAHTLSLDDIVKQLTTDRSSGLTSNEAANRLKDQGRNEIGDAEPPSVADILLSQITNAMTLVLILAVVASLSIRSWVEGGVIAFVLLLNIVVGFFQEYSTEKTMDSLRSLGSPSAGVIRDGRQSTIPSGEAVQGDLIEVKVGDTVPADIRIFDSVNFETDEALLTGESLAVVKDDKAIFTKDTGVGDRLNLAYSSSTVTKGRAKGIVFATGPRTQIGQIATQLKGEESRMRTVRRNSQGQAKYHDHAKAYIFSCSDLIGSFLGLNKGTPLQRKLSKLAVLLFGVAVIFAIIVLAANRFDGRQEVVIYAVATGVAMIPASLVVVLTITMAAGTKVMVKRHVIVRDLRSLEALGGVTDICSDKTGTLTQGSMIARKAWIPGNGTFTVENTSETANPTKGDVLFEPETSKKAGNQDTKHRTTLEHFVQAARLANIAEVKQKPDGSWEARGDPTEIAIQVFASRASVADRVTAFECADWEKHIELPFDSDVKRMSVLVSKSEDKQRLVFTKGAVERVLDICTSFPSGESSELSGIDQQKIHILEKMELLASQGLRVLALAYKEFTDAEQDPKKMKREEIESNLTFCGLIGLYDPPRIESAAAVKACHQAGIEVHMLTGDHLGTARAIAVEVGILPSKEYLNQMPKNVADSLVVTAAEFDKKSDEEIDQLETLPLVVARCAPQTKVRMIEALHRRGRFCAMTGDGVNDSPSLKRADVGIAMGQVGSDVAKEASDLVLTDDNFASIVAAIEEGRRIFDNIQKFMLHVLAENISQALILLLGLVFKDATGASVFPLAPVQVIWIIMATSGAPDMGLGFEKAVSNIMKRPPHNMKTGIFTKEFLVDMVVYGIWVALLCLSSFALVVFGFGDGNLGENCNETYSDSCELVFRARATTFACLTWFALFLAWEMVDTRESFFRMQSEGNSSSFKRLYHSIYDNQFLFWAIMAGFLTLFPLIYIPVINTAVFKHAPISWEWAIVFVSTGLFFAGVELWKAGKRMFFARRAARQAGETLSSDNLFDRYLSTSTGSEKDV